MSDTLHEYMNEFHMDAACVVDLISDLKERHGNIIDVEELNNKARSVLTKIEIFYELLIEYNDKNN